MILIGTPHAKGAGYFVNDQALRTRKEADVRTCTHCQAVIKMQEWKDNGAFCHKCMAPICVRCGGIAEKFGCVPFTKKLEEYVEKQERLLKTLDLTPGVSTSILTGKP